VLILVALGVLGIRMIPEERLPVWLLTATGLTWIAIACSAAAAAVRFALGAQRVDGEHVAAALSAYLLAGLLFAMIYVVVDYTWPGSIVEPGAGPEASLTLDAAVYCSLVTLATPRVPPSAEAE
jgi:hypothetical protein